MKERRKAQILKRKNFLPTLVLTLLLWIATGFLVYAIDPFSFAAVPAFFVLIFLALLFTFSLIFANTRRGLVVSISLILFLILRYLGIGNILNFLLIAGIATAIELYSQR